MPRVVLFEVPADDPERAAQFYRSVFGWEIGKWKGPTDFWWITTGPDAEPGINGGIRRRTEPVGGGAASAYVCTVRVSSVDEAVSRVVASGGAVILSKMAIPGVGWQAYCQDTEGNQFGVQQEDRSAR